jgi:hypothetical protein
VVTVAAGNNAIFDSAADNPYVLTVSATDANDALASFSNTGNNVDLAAPGVDIITTASGGDYGSGTGTSFSAPVVAGVAALVISANPALSGSQVQQILKDSADDLGTPGWDTTFGAGRVNAHRAVAAAVATSGETNAPPDAVPPTTSITAPTGGSTVSGVVLVNVNALDNVGVTRLEFYLDGVLIGSNSTSPAEFLWDTTRGPDGSCAVEARAYDSAGNVGSAAVSVSVQNSVQNLDSIAPTVQITSPAEGATLSGRRVNVSVIASDNVRVTRVEFLVDGKLYSTSTSTSPVFLWNISKLSRGRHTIQAVASDAAGNRTRSTTVTVNK